MNAPPPDAAATFGEFLAFLRKRARLTQSELGRAVGYSREQITRLEKNQRAPDPAIVATRFVPALGLEPADAARLLALAKLAAPAGHDSPTGRVQGRAFNNLPALLLPLVGRVSEQDDLTRQLQGDARLLTLTGAAGVGKTRLALQVAHRVANDFWDGVAFVSLAPISDASLVPSAILQTLAPEAAPNDEPTALVLTLLREKNLLLVLDNFEQILDAALFVSELLEHAPQLKILVTSRTPLQLYGEFQFPLRPLALPQLDALPALETLAQLPSVALFLARIHQVKRELNLTPDNAQAIAALCVQLDGLPLALEIAAAQLKHLSLAELRDGLEHNPHTLTYPARNMPERHHSLTNALAWSYDHLAPDAQRVFEWLGVFPGGATVEMFGALQLVSNPRALLDTLVEASLVQVQAAPDETRYTLFETVRQFVREKLAVRDALHNAEEQHANIFLELAESAEPHLTGADQQVWLSRLEREHDNFRRALAVSLEPSSSGETRALRLCNALWKFWRYRCDLVEGYEWTTRALADGQPNTTDMNVLAQRAGAEWGAGVLAAAMKRETQATAHLEQSLQLWQMLEDEMGVAAALTALGARAMDRRDFAGAVDLQTQALALYTREGDAAGMAYARNALGETWRAAGNFPESKLQYQASLDLARRAGHERSIAVAQSNLASIELATGDVHSARAHLLASVPIFIALNDRVNIASCIATLACLYAGVKPPHLEQAAQLFAFATQQIADTHGKFEAADQAEFEKWIARCRRKLGAHAFEQAWRQGMTLTLEDAVECIQAPDIPALK